jgi:pyridinium-3,5-bisthiocarboxylic acid mononucleotide nickel chelatase
MSEQRILYFDCSCGISGDMAIGALVDLGLPTDHLLGELAKLGLPGWSLSLKPDSKNGIGGTRADVILADDHAHDDSHNGHPHDHDHDHDHDGHHDRHDHPHDHGNRSYRDIVGLIEESALRRGAKDRALGIFRKLAVAEASVHGCEPDEVRFHEVGAVDSIVDIVGAAIGIEFFAPDRILCSRIELGGGFVKCQHGLLPVPAPAVARLLENAPVKLGAVHKETTTPTGAAILAACVDEYDDSPSLTIEKSAYGIGHRDHEIPNVLRLFIGRSAPVAAVNAARLAAETGILIECNIDDMNPEIYGYLFDRLFGAGASDVWVTPIVMKKGRPAATLSVLCEGARERAVVDIVLSETSTFGFRKSVVEKTALERTVFEFVSSLGPVRVKTAFLGGTALKSKPEYEDLRRIAEARGLPIRRVQEQVMREFLQPREAGA